MIRSVFSGEPMMIGTFDGVARPRLAQSSKSKALHFRSRICEKCNSTRSQPADLEFARFDEIARRRLAGGLNPSGAFNEPQYLEGGGPYLDVFRYLAKVLACQIADVDGPRVCALTDFAIGRTDANPVRLEMSEDPAYRQWFEGSGDPEFAGHGGLGVGFSRSTGLAESLFSTLTHGPLRYSFSIGFGPPIAYVLRLLHPRFYERCANAFRDTTPTT